MTALSGAPGGITWRRRLLRWAPRAALFDLLVALIAFGFVWSLPRGDSLLDFGSFVASGQAAAEGKDPYGAYRLTFRPYFASIGVVETPNLNPPISVLAFEPLACLEPRAAFRAWYAISLGLYLAALGLLIHAYWGRVGPLRVVWALSLAGLWHTLQLGQIYMPLLLATTGAWLLLRRGRHAAAGLLIGAVVAVKPNFALWPLLALAGGYWQVALAATASAAALSLAPLAVYGPGIYSQWLAAANSFAGAVLPGNSSLPGLAARVGVPTLGPLAAGALALGAAILVWRRRPPILDVSGLAILVSLLASPITWLGYTVLLLPVLFGRRWSLALRLAAAGLSFPLILVLSWFQMSRLHFVVLGWAYGWALLAALGGEMAARGRTVTTPAKHGEPRDGPEPSLGMG